MRVAGAVTRSRKRAVGSAAHLPAAATQPPCIQLRTRHPSHILEPTFCCLRCLNQHWEAFTRAVSGGASQLTSAGDSSWVLSALRQCGRGGVAWGTRARGVWRGAAGGEEVRAAAGRGAKRSGGRGYQGRCYQVSCNEGGALGVRGRLWVQEGAFIYCCTHVQGACWGCLLRVPLLRRCLRLIPHGCYMWRGGARSAAGAAPGCLWLFLVWVCMAR